MKDAARGALVHYSEANATEAAASPPWIAFINCDSNVTAASQEVDIFTQVRDSGAVAALLYSLSAAACSMNEDYIVNFEKPIDVYSTTNLQAARLINSQFNNVGTQAYWYSSETLNASESGIYRDLNNTVQILSSAVSEVTASDTASMGAPTDSENYSLQPTSFIITQEASSSDPAAINDQSTAQPTRVKRQATSTQRTATGTPTSSGAAYLIAVLANQQAVFSNGTDNNTTSTASGSNDGGGGGTNMTGLAMIILYAITGCVTVMFLIVILSGAIKAIRHPERYGPRAGLGPNNRGGQTRASGLTRAILDTFPVVKFGRTGDADSVPAKDDDVAMNDIEGGAPVLLRTAGAGQPRVSGEVGNTERTILPPPVAASTEDGAPLSEIDPANVDHSSTCPICVQDFEDGEDLRVLPCDGRHRFHMDCIDPWLLNVSSLCPLCRLDLSNNGQPAEDEAENAEENIAPTPTGFTARARHLLLVADNAVSGRHLGHPAPFAFGGGREASNGTTGPTATRSRFATYVRTMRNRNPAQEQA